MARMNWTNQQINAELARRVLTMMGADVTTQSFDTSTVFPAMSRANNVIDMEAWAPTAQAQIDEFVTKQSTVVKVGPTGYDGEEGWYVPTYVIKGDPSRGIEPSCPGLPDWRALNDCVEVFATSESEGKARYLSGDPAWEPLYGDQDRVKNLGLDVQVDFAGSEAALAAEWTRALERGEPMLGLIWRPHLITSKYDLTLIDLPPFTTECWETTRACGWDNAPQNIYASASFGSDHPVAEQFLKNYGLPIDSLNSIIVRIDGDGLTVEEAVDEWMKSNTALWQSWIPTTV
ncbi:hypothetical protein O4220_12485 [Rhodococcus ruber]|uniref:ABC-type glycine betaine transport system substrate-binding domain-containing protein n=2 Tax=Rhodococcus ruber TaxID=1830 RepID=A0ABT4MH14_9NOCA|nr:glycine betaine ABC transporter substrate-binding protein [Rhodococcus ruber]MCZ4519335.1 hypothetical protein [Rhodococcus ruber]